MPTKKAKPESKHAQGLPPIVTDPRADTGSPRYNTHHDTWFKDLQDELRELVEPSVLEDFKVVHGKLDPADLDTAKEIIKECRELINKLRDSVLGSERKFQDLAQFSEPALALVSRAETFLSTEYEIDAGSSEERWLVEARALITLWVDQGARSPDDDD